MIDRLLHPFEFFAASYLATVLLAVGCAYLGVFIALRRVVFLGIALAEISAAGLAAGLFAASAVTGATDAQTDAAALAGSVLFALAGVAVLATRFAEKHVSREGIVAAGYAAGATAAILLVWKSAHDLEHVKNILAGSSLYVNDAQLATIAAAFVLIGLVHVAYRKEFAFCAYDPVMARTLGIPARRMELLFYVTVGLAIALALRTLGVLSVFGFLALPPLEGLLLARRFGPAFLHAVAQALVASALGLLAADVYDLPAGPATVAVLAAMLAPAALASRVDRFRKVWIAIEGAGAVGALVLAGFSVHAYVHQHGFAHPDAHAHARAAPRGPVRLEGVDDVTGSHAAIVHHAIEEIQSGDEHGVAELIAVLGSDASPFDRSEALDALRPIGGGDLGYDPDRDAAGNAAPLRRWREWYSHVRGRLVFDRSRRTFKEPSR